MTVLTSHGNCHYFAAAVDGRELKRRADVPRVVTAIGAGFSIAPDLNKALD